MDPVTLAAAAQVGGGTLGNIIGAQTAVRAQKKLLDYQYESYWKNAQKAGATPAAIAQGITGSSPGGSMPAVSSVGGIGDLGNVITAARDVQSKKERSDVQNELDLLTMKWNPKIWSAEINKIRSDVGVNKSSIALNGSLRKLYDEQMKDLILLRPWKIVGLSQGITNQMAEYNKILAETNTIRKQGSLYDKQGNYYDSASYNQWNQGYNESLKGFALNFQNFLMSHGFDPNKKPWDNVIHLSLTDPSQFKSLMSTFGSSVSLLDDKFKESLGEHYKRNIAIGAGLYGLNNLIGKHMSAKLDRLNNALSGISKVANFAPLLF